ncbi:MAG TPA: hypothetical protein VNK91_15660 [Burkholderiaceae bacterium]|nr:hypothetical protein [Burkholderiaceae bacterium]
MAKAWETAGSTDFVITTVNVPDRLDLQEVRARADEDVDRTERFRIDWYAIRVWVVRLLLIGLVGAAGLFAWEAAQPIRAELSADRIAQRLTAATRQQVRVADTGFVWTPTPRFVVSGVEIGKVWRAESVSIHFNWADAWRAVRGGGWIWGEASVAPTKLDLGQAEFLVRALPGLGPALPRSISTVRFESIEFPAIELLPGRYEGVIRRQGDGSFGAITLRGLAENATLSASPPAADADGIRFQFNAANWPASVGPRVVWTEAHATGAVRANLVEVKDFLLVGYFGSVKGAVYAAADREWVVTGTALGANLDIEAMLKQATGVRETDEAARPSVAMAGTANFEWLLSGWGATFEEAVASATAAGPFRVRWATINGINLGYAATRPGAASGPGGATRFTELSGWVVAGPKGTLFQDLEGRAGALAARGQILMGAGGSLSGSLRVDLGGTRVQAPLNLRIGGTIAAPLFGR